MMKKVDNLPYIIDNETLKRFSQRQNVFGRKLYDSKADFYQKGMYDNVPKIVSENKEGYSHIDHAKVMGAWTVYDYFHNAFSWEKLKDANSTMKKPTLEKYPVEDSEKMGNEIKNAAELYGAFKTGITKVNEKWIYSENLDGEKINIPQNCNNAIVMLVKMDGSMINKSPSFIAGQATGLAYSKMAFIIGCMAEFIRNLGYTAIPMGNDTALSIPLAIDAGLGELGRNGLLITPEYGPCVRICKIFTDLPLTVDKPIEFGVKDFCKSCNKCVESCEADAIQNIDPSYDIVCKSNNKGIFRWAVNHDKCYNFWIKNGGECSNCIAACPFFTRKI